jgi:hypothetical protein
LVQEKYQEEKACDKRQRRRRQQYNNNNKIPGDSKVIKKEAEKILKHKDLKI